jgi:hypothetical protein
MTLISVFCMPIYIRNTKIFVKPIAFLLFVYYINHQDGLNGPDS